ncbi:MAG: CDP-alcohol phosphatidyltransferase family protein [Peptococcaceae bacterium]|nr:CDP-alcohol phosphatidyltransferase family protein [Peptococcaceae bacterium]
MLDTKARRHLQPLFEQLAATLTKLGLGAIGATLVALGLGIAAALAVWGGFYLGGVALLWFSGLFDVLDGTIARLTKSSSAIGTVMDIVFDRLVEILVLLALTIAYPSLGVGTALVFASIILSMTVFLTVGAVAEKTGNKSFYYQPGLVERTEGFIMISLAVLLAEWRALVLVVFAALIFFTALQRFAEAVRLLRTKN